MRHITVIRSSKSDRFEVYYKNTLVGSFHQTDPLKMSILFNQALKIHDAAEREGWVNSIVDVSKSVYRLDHHEVSEPMMVRLIKEKFA